MGLTSQEEIVREAIKHQHVLTVYAYGILKDWSLAQDAVQETLIAVSTKWDTYREDVSLAGWLKRITHNKAIDILRSRKRHVTVEDEALMSLVDRSFNSYIESDRAELFAEKRTALYACMSKLPERSRSLLLGFYRDRQSCEALAIKEDRSVNAIWLSLSRIRKQLRKCAAQQLASLEGTA